MNLSDYLQFGSNKFRQRCSLNNLHFVGASEVLKRKDKPGSSTVSLWVSVFTRSSWRRQLSLELYKLFVRGDGQGMTQPSRGLWKLQQTQISLFGSKYSARGDLCIYFCTDTTLMGKGGGGYLKGLSAAKHLV